MKYLFLVCLLFSNLSADYAATYIFFVSPSGSDANPGTQEAPFLTPQAARDAVRALPSSAFKNQDVFILFRGGTYRMQETLQLTQADSGREGHDVVYSAYPGETPVFSGAVQVSGPWSVYQSSPIEIYQASVTANTYYSRQLYVNGSFAQRAQTTAYPTAFLPSWASSGDTNGIQYRTPNANPSAWSDPTTWTNPSSIEAVILTQWKMMRVPIQAVNAPVDNYGLIEMVQPAWNNANVYFSSGGAEPGVWSFWQVTRFENALQFLTTQGQWYLDSAGGYLYYSPLSGQNISTADVELPVLEVLVQGQGSAESPITNIRFEGITFSYATWLGPNGSNGYVADQSGFLLEGSDHVPNIIGHDPNVVPTPGNIQFFYAQNIVFWGNIFQNLGAVALQCGTGSQNITIDSNLFSQVSSSAIFLGGVSSTDQRPSLSGQMTKNNTITNNLITNVAAEYNDAAGIFIGFSKKTTVSYNTIVNASWSGIATGWGWGLLDKGSYPGLPNGYSGEWGTFDSLTINYGSKFINNRISGFVNNLWDGGAIYTTGRQGPSLEDGLLIKGNVASGKMTADSTSQTSYGGGNTIYTDGGSRYIQVEQNVSFDNPVGAIYFGPDPYSQDDYFSYPVYYLGNGSPYGSDSGGCRTYGDMKFTENYWLQDSLQAAFSFYNYEYNYNIAFNHPAYSEYGFFAPCPYSDGARSYPTKLTYENNYSGFSLSDVPSSLLSEAGVQSRPSTIPASLWILP